MISETSVVEQMQHFSSCGRCLSYIKRRKENLKNLYIRDDLHPFLQNFFNYLNQRELSQEISSYCSKEDRFVLQGGRSFHYFIRRFGDQLFSEFQTYLEFVDSSLVEDYIQSCRNDYRVSDHERENDQSRTKPLDVYGNLEEEAIRLVLTIEQDRGHTAALSLVIANNIKNFPEFLEFLEWLKKNYSSYQVDQNTSREEIEEIVTHFCEELGYDNTQEFLKEIINWLSPTWIHKLFNLLSMEMIPEKRASFIELSSFLKFRERYETILFHGVFLFGQNDSFSEFVKNNGRDLHDLTDDHIDIYYSQADLKDDITGYQRRRQFKNIDIQSSHIPAFIIWKNSLTNYQIFSFEGLSHQQMFEVVKHITNAIEQKKSLDEIYEIGMDKIEKCLQGHSTVTNNYNQNIDNKGELVMNHGDHYEVSGQAGAVGRNATALSNTNVQVKQELASANLDSDSLNKLQELANCLTKGNTPDDISQSIIYEAVSKLLAIKEEGENQNQEEQAKAVTNWRQWLHGVGEKAQKYLSVTADAVSLGLPLLKLLGLPIP
jgi:hypothetical protein